MAWEALPSAAIGAIIALSGTLLADLRRDRRLRVRDRDVDRRRCCVEFTVALVEAHGALRAVNRADTDTVRRSAVAAAMQPLYVAREQLLVSGTADLVVAGEDVFHRLVGVRDAVRAGAPLDSVGYHEAYHGFAEALWRFRITVRADLQEPVLVPADLDRLDWTERDGCRVCSPGTGST